MFLLLVFLVFLVVMVYVGVGVRLVFVVLVLCWSCRPLRGLLVFLFFLFSSSKCFPFVLCYGFSSVCVCIVSIFSSYIRLLSASCGVVI